MSRRSRVMDRRFVLTGQTAEDQMAEDRVKAHFHGGKRLSKSCRLAIDGEVNILRAMEIGEMIGGPVPTYFTKKAEGQEIVKILRELGFNASLVEVS